MPVISDTDSRPCLTNYHPPTTTLPYDQYRVGFEEGSPYTTHNQQPSFVENSGSLPPMSRFCQQSVPRLTHYHPPSTTLPYDQYPVGFEEGSPYTTHNQQPSFVENSGSLPPMSRFCQQSIPPLTHYPLSTGLPKDGTSLRQFSFKSCLAGEEWDVRYVEEQRIEKQFQQFLTNNEIKEKFQEFYQTVYKRRKTNSQPKSLHLKKIRFAVLAGLVTIETALELYAGWARKYNRAARIKNGEFYSSLRKWEATNFKPPVLRDGKSQKGGYPAALNACFSAHVFSAIQVFEKYVNLHTPTAYDKWIERFQAPAEIVKYSSTLWKEVHKKDIATISSKIDKVKEEIEKQLTTLFESFNTASTNSKQDREILLPIKRNLIEITKILSLPSICETFKSFQLS
jgi:hypothetical protein